jgi:DNA repair exonuclease SbcCD ATPase subunit
LVNSVNNKDCLVEIEFIVDGGKQYKIARGIKPNIFEIYCDGVCLNQNSATKDYQEHLEKFILKTNYKAFTQIVVLGSASFTPFMQLSPSDRRSVIEELLDIHIFSVMNVIVKEKLQANREHTEKNRTMCSGKEEKKSFIEKTIVSLKDNDEQKIQEIQDQIKLCEAELADLNVEIKNLEDIRNGLLNRTVDLPKVTAKYNKLISLKTQMGANYGRYKSELLFYENNDDCPTCRQSIDNEFKTKKKELLLIKIDEMESGLEKISKEIDVYLTLLLDRNKLVSEAENFRNEITSNKTRHKVTKEKLKSWHCILEKEDDVLLQSSKSELEVTRKEIEKLIAEKTALLDNRMFIETAITLLKDGGIKSKIIKQYLPIINKQINRYLAQMGFFVDFHIDENFEETIKSRYRDEFSYQNFSEGEKGRLDLALLFAWRAIAKMKNSVNTNLLIFDEIFDSSLDLNGTDEFLKIMWTLPIDTNVFVISHKIDTLLDKFKKIIRFRKSQNFSRMEI